jgi:hypothetical protein
MVYSLDRLAILIKKRIGNWKLINTLLYVSLRQSSLGGNYKATLDRYWFFLLPNTFWE